MFVLPDMYVDTVVECLRDALKFHSGFSVTVSDDSYVSITCFDEVFAEAHFTPWEDCPDSPMCFSFELFEFYPFPVFLSVLSIIEIFSLDSIYFWNHCDHADFSVSFFGTRHVFDCFEDFSDYISGLAGVEIV